jgi:hypothetical protein
MLNGRIGIQRTERQTNLNCLLFVLVFRCGFFAIAPFGFKPSWLYVGVRF